MKATQETPDLFRRRARWAWGVIGRGKWVILGCLLLILAPTITYLNKAERLYTARVDVLIEAPDTGENLLERSYGKSRLTESAIQTEADIMESTALADKVIAKLRLDEDPEFNRALMPPSAIGSIIAAINPLPYLTGAKTGEAVLSAAGRENVARAQIQGMFSSRLTVTSRRRSFVISIDFVSNSGEKAALIANTLADLYVLDRLEVSLEETRRANDWLSERLDELRRDVGVAEQAAEQFRSQHNLSQSRRGGERQLSVTDQQLVELNSRLVLARSDLAQKQARYSQLRDLGRDRGSLDTAYDVLQSSLIQRLREQEVMKQRELSEASKTYGERHPRIIGLQADLQELRSKIGQEVSKIAASLASETEASRIGVSSLEKQIADLQKGSNTASGFEVELRELERQAEASRGLYESFLARYKRDSEQESIQRANARVLSQASVPVKPSSPRRLRIFAMAVLFSMVGGVGLVFLLDRLNGRIRSADEVEPILGLPLLAVIPKWKTSKKAKGGLNYATLDMPRSALANAFRSLQVVMAATNAGRQQPLAGSKKVAVVTSSIPGEGKSFVVRNLAMAAAAAGNRVLLIDGDLMRPTQHSLANLSAQTGLTQLLSDPSLSAESLLLHEERGRFDLLPAGALDAFSGNALAGGRFADVVAQLAANYDRVFIDAPPCLATTDAQTLAGIADQVLFVVKWNDTPRDAILTAVSYLQKAGAQICGVVLSQADLPGLRKNSYGAYGYYGYYGSYDGYAKNS